MSWWRYQGRCFVRILHFLYHYCGLDVAEQATVGEDVTYRGKRIATIAWSESFGEADVPVFAFEGEHADRWMEAQGEQREKAIVDALPKVQGTVQQPIAPEQIHAFDPDIERRATLWAGIVAETWPRFFTAGTTLYFVAGKHCFYWSREIGAWLRAAAPDGDACEAKPKLPNAERGKTMLEGLATVLRKRGMEYDALADEWEQRGLKPPPAPGDTWNWYIARAQECFAIAADLPRLAAAPEAKGQST